MSSSVSHFITRVTCNVSCVYHVRNKPFFFVALLVFSTPVLMGAGYEGSKYYNTINDDHNWLFLHLVKHREINSVSSPGKKEITSEAPG